MPSRAVDDDDAAPPGCCACLERRGTGGILLGASLISNETQQQRAANIRLFFAGSALAHWFAIASLFAMERPGHAEYLALPLLLTTAALSVYSVREMQQFQEMRPGYLPSSAAIPPPCCGSGDASDSEACDASALLAQERLHTNVEWCAPCHAYVRRPSAHCRACGQCTELMDHHCAILLTCVGKDNRRAYSLLTLATLAVGVLYFVVAVHAAPAACADVPPLAAIVNRIILGADSTMVGTAPRPLHNPLSAGDRDVPPSAPYLRCALPVTLVASTAYGSLAMACFLLQELFFVLLVTTGDVETEGCDWRLWVLERLRIGYWTRQRQQLGSARPAG